MGSLPTDEPEDKKLVKPLPEDNTPPFSPPDDVPPLGDDDQGDDVGGLDDTHQATDSNLDATEVYDEDLSGAAEAGEPNARNTVTGYEPEDDVRKRYPSS